MWETVLGVVVGGAAFLGALGVISRAAAVRWLVRRNVIQPYTEWHEASTERVARRVVTDHHRAEVHPRLEAIEAQFHPNAGSSLRDRVDVVAQQVGAEASPPPPDQGDPHG